MTNTTKTIDLEQLATVTGGTAAETAELKQAILGNPDLAAIWKRKSERYGFDDAETCHMVLREAFEVVYSNCSETDSNVYQVISNGVDYGSLSHSDMISFVKNYRAI